MEFHEFCRSNAKRTGRIRCFAVPRMTRSAAKTCARGSMCFRKFPRMARGGFALVENERVSSAKIIFRIATCRISFLSNARRRVADFAGTRAGLHGKSGVRSQTAHGLGTHRNAQYEDALKNFVTTALRDAEFHRDLEQFHRVARRSRANQFAGANADQTHRARRAGHLSGQRTLGFQPG